MVVWASADRTGSRAAGYVDHVTQKRSLAMKLHACMWSYVRLQADNSLMVEAQTNITDIPGPYDNRGGGVPRRVLKLL